MRYPVTRDPDNKTEIIELDLNDVIYIDTGDRSVVFHTPDEVYYPVLPRISNLEMHLGQLGFRKLDRTNLVNTAKITHYDHEHALVFFDDQITKNSKYATISMSERGQFKKLRFGKTLKRQPGEA